MGVSGPQLLIIVIVIAILFMGPSRIPGIGKSLGQAIRGFKKAMRGEDIDNDQVENDQANPQVEDKPSYAADNLQAEKSSNQEK